MPVGTNMANYSILMSSKPFYERRIIVANAIECQNSGREACLAPHIFLASQDWPYTIFCSCRMELMQLHPIHGNEIRAVGLLLEGEGLTLSLYLGFSLAPYIDWETTIPIISHDF